MDFFTFDDEYVRRLREGDRWTEEHFLSYFQQLLLIKLRRRLPSLQAIDDVRQEVFVRVFRMLRAEDGGLRDGRKLGAYVNTVCNNVLFEQYRQGNRDEPLLDEHRELPTSEDVESALVAAEEREQVRRVIAKLPKRDADILRALFLEERTSEDVCALFGVDRGYLRVLLYRAKEKFRTAWRDGGVKLMRPESDPQASWPKPGSDQ
jgi:RNA polymerase sigma-70 factor (ECF subfamily)